MRYGCALHCYFSNNTIFLSATMRHCGGVHADIGACTHAYMRAHEKMHAFRPKHSQDECRKQALSTCMGYTRSATMCHC